MTTQLSLSGASPAAEPVRRLLLELGRSGRLRRCHIVIASHAGDTPDG